MNPRALWAAAQRWYATHSGRDRRILLGVAIAALLSVVYVGIVQPVRAYRRSVTEEIGEGQEELERSARFLAAAEGLKSEREQLVKKLEQAKSRLLPGDTGTLGAAALQERTNALASEKNITVQSTQVLKEEPAEPFHKVSVRLTLSGELKPFADFVSGLEYGPQALTIPFVEVSRRGAVAGQKGPRTLSATIEVGGYLMASAKSDKGKKGEGENAEGENEAASAVEGEGPAPMVPEGAAVPAPEGKPAEGQPAAEGQTGPPPVVQPPPGPGETLPKVEAPPAGPPGPPVAAAPNPPTTAPAPPAGAVPPVSAINPQPAARPEVD